MATKIADIYALLTLDDSQYKQRLNAAKGETSAFGNVMQGIFQGVGQRLFTGIVSGVETFVSKIGDAVAASSDLNESINKTGVIFGEGTQEVLRWSETSATALGLSQQKALEAASGFGALAKQMGGTTPQAVDFGETLVGLAADLASFNNIDPTVSLQKLKSGLAGESEPLKAVNVFLNETIVAQRAVKLGLAESTDAVSESAKVWARYSLILEQTKAAQGDFARTSNSLANEQRILAAQFQDGAAKIGNTFRPALEAITGSLINIAPQMFQYGQNIMDQLANGLAAGIRAILPVITTVRQLLAYWFAPGSPPRVAPDIDKWGAAAMQQFLGGFTSVDVKGAFDNIGRAIETILRSDVTAGKADEGGLVGRVLGSRAAITAAVAEFKTVGSVSEATLQRIVRSAGSAGGSMAALVKSYFDVQKATDSATRAQEQLNRITERYDAILTPLRGALDAVRAEQQKLADQQRLVAARNVLNNFDSTAAEKRQAQLEIEQISLEDQISTAEQKKKVESDTAQAALDSAKKEEDAAQKKLDIAQATIDQQVQVNTLLGEQAQLEQRLAQQREADAKRAQSEAEQAANKAKQQAEEAQRLADQLHDAQLRYNLELSDTPGKIKLMQGELAKTTVGSVEYFNILTQIHQLQEQYNHELEQAAKNAGALSDPALAGGISGNITGPLGEASKAGKNLADALKEAFAPLPAASESVRNLADKIDLVVTKIAALFGIDLSTWGQKTKTTTGEVSDSFILYGHNVDRANADVGASIDRVTAKILEFVGIIDDIVSGNWAALWEKYKKHALESNSEVDKDTQTKLDHIQTIINFFQYITNLSWGKYWADWKLIWSTGLGAVSKAIGDWFNGTVTAITNFGKAFYNGGANLLGQFWDGLKSKWTEISSWFTSKLAALRAQLPFSEPKDPSSPLRGLTKSGEAMVGMVQEGIKNASLSINPLANSLLPAGSTTNNSTANNMNFTININGGGDVTGIKQGVKDSILESLRSVGLA